MAKVVYRHTKNQTSELLLLRGDVTEVNAHAIVTGESWCRDGVSAVTRTLFRTYPEFKSKREQLFEKEKSRLFKLGPYLEKWKAYITELDKDQPIIIHAVMDIGNNDVWLDLMRKLYSRVFTEAEKLNGVQVLALPVLGTGNPDCDRNLAVEALVLSLRYYTPGYVRRILIVSPSSHILKLVEARYNESLTNPERKDSFFKSAFKDIKHSLSSSCYMDETKLTEDRKKRQQLTDKETEDLQITLLISKTVTRYGDDTQHSSEGEDWGHAAATSSYHESTWNSGGASRRLMLDKSDERTNCPICLNHVQDPKQLDKCHHVFCRACIERSFLEHKPVCPSCNMLYGEIRGDQPDGQMDVGFSGEHLPGYEGQGTITITYYFPSATQGTQHPHPGEPYKGTTRRAYLPDTKEGRSVLKLLRKAFDLKLIFTIGRSSSTGQDDVITWNDIHHKTNKVGGPTRYGYPDPTYLQRVRDELESKGVTDGSTVGL